MTEYSELLVVEKQKFAPNCTTASTSMHNHRMAAFDTYLLRQYHGVR